MRGGNNKKDFVAKARGAWGDDLPDWVRVVAEEATRTSLAVVAGRTDLSVGLFSNVIANKYPGDMERVELVVRGALMGLTVTCPVLGDIARNVCLEEQRRPFSATSSVRSRTYRACRSGCPHSRLAPSTPE